MKCNKGKRNVVIYHDKNLRAHEIHEEKQILVALD